MYLLLQKDIFLRLCELGSDVARCILYEQLTPANQAATQPIQPYTMIS